MVRAICRRLRREDGVWGVLAASSVAALLLAALALSLDLSAASSARVIGQAALDASLRTAAHYVVPTSVASEAPSVDGASAGVFALALSESVPPPLEAAITSGPTVERGRLSAAISLRVPLPAVLGAVTIPLKGEVAVGWLPH